MDPEREEELWDFLRQAMRLSEDDFERLKVGGLKMNYLRVCPRKLWLFAHQVRLEADAEAVALGRLTHERAYRDRPRRSLILENLIAIDVLEGEGTILEVKHAPTFIEAARLQLRYYLYFLARRGVHLRGELRFPRQRRRETVILDAAAGGRGGGRPGGDRPHRGPPHPAGRPLDARLPPLRLRPAVLGMSGKISDEEDRSLHKPSIRRK